MIPPKGIKRGNNKAGTELLNGEEMGNDASVKMMKMALVLNSCWQH